ncbi:MAG: imidazolonepropionase-like amidohydrolase, partial [Planctomycetota bacterium]
EGVRGVAAGYQSLGVDLVGFNTDSPVLPQEELPMQAAVGVRYGFDDTSLQAVRGLTVVPAITTGVQHRIGSIGVGLDADLVILDGHPADPRTTVSIVYVDGVKHLDLTEDKRLW